MTLKNEIERGEAMLFTVVAKHTNQSSRIARLRDAYLRSYNAFLRRDNFRALFPVNRQQGTVDQFQSGPKTLVDKV